MKLRFATGSGCPPVYLNAITHDKEGRGQLQFAGGAGGALLPVIFRSEADLYTKLSALLQRAVPISVGGHSPGAAAEVAMLLEIGKLNGRYVEISWSRPDHWTVREMIKGAVEWESVARADTFVMAHFDPTSIGESLLNQQVSEVSRRTSQM